MDKNDSSNDKKTATTETQKQTETQKLSASAKFSGSVVAREILLKENEELKEKLEEFENNYKRALADYQNLEKRVLIERKEWIRKSNKDLLLHLLPVLDTLILAQKHVNVEDKGLSLGIMQFQDFLKNENVERIEALGKNFDPHFMECIETVDGEEGKVIEEIRAGYMLSLIHI